LVFRRPLCGFGIKVLFDDTEADFTLDSPLPLVWQRSYYSDQPGNGWLGQGWSLPFSMRLIRTADGFLYIDEQGREIPLPDIDDEEGGAAFDEDNFEEEAEAADEPEDDPYGLAGSWFDRYEQICFARVAGTDGLAGVFRAEDGRLYVNRLSAVTFDCYTPSYEYHLEAIHQLLKLLDGIKIRFSL